MSTPTFPDVRKQIALDTNYRIARGDVSVALSEDHNRAKFSHRYVLSVTGDQPETEWEVGIPSLPPDVHFSGASGADGGLQHTFVALGNSTRVLITYRRTLDKDSAPYEFWYSYETAVKCLVVRTMRGRIVSYNNWVMSDVACDQMKILIQLPARCRAIQSFPAANLESNSISLQYDHMRPLEVFAYSLAYQHSKLGNEIWIWIIGAIVSGWIGAIIAKLLG